MKVLHLTTHLNTGGITIYILNLIRPLKEQGIETHILSSGGEWESEFRNKGAAVHQLPIKTKSELSPKVFFAIPTIIKIIHEQHIDILHAHTRVTQVLAFWVSRFVRIPVVTTCHGFYKRRLGRLILPSWGDRAIAISEPVAASLRNDFRVPSDKIRVINNAVGIQKLDQDFRKHNPSDVRKEYGFSDEDFVVGVVARLVKDKGHQYLLEAAKLLQSEIPNIKIVIVGDGNQKGPLGEKTRELGLMDRVFFTGNVGDVTRPLAAMDIFAFPATWREGFGLSIVEAMTLRKPVIVSNIWALNSLIHNGKTGILVEPKRADLLAEAISSLYRDKILRDQIGEDGRKMVELLFSIDRMANDIAGVYKELSPVVLPKIGLTHE